MRNGQVRFRGWMRSVAVVAWPGSLVVAACELDRVTVPSSENTILVESWVALSDDDDGEWALEAFAFLRHPLGRWSPTVPGADVRVSGQDGAVVALEERGLEDCVRSESAGAFLKETGTCYRASMSLSPFSPGDQLRLTAKIPDGRKLSATSQIPGAFSLADLVVQDGRCRLVPETNHVFEWTSSPGARAYVTDAHIMGRFGWVPSNPDRVDTLYLTGRFMSSRDTATVFPRDYGLTEFLQAGSSSFRDMLRTLQSGLPDGAQARIALLAVDANWTNWVRGETLDPTRPRHVPSVSEGGTGWFGAAIKHRIEVVAGAEREGSLPPCADPT